MCKALACGCNCMAHPTPPPPYGPPLLNRHSHKSSHAPPHPEPPPPLPLPFLCICAACGKAGPVLPQSRTRLPIVNQFSWPGPLCSPSPSNLCLVMCLFLNLDLTQFISLSASSPQCLSSQPLNCQVIVPPPPPPLLLFLPVSPPLIHRFLIPCVPCLLSSSFLHSQLPPLMLLRPELPFPWDSPPPQSLPPLYYSYQIPLSLPPPPPLAYAPLIPLHTHFLAEPHLQST